MKILDRLPFLETRSEVWTPDRLVTVKPYQIVVTVSLLAGEALEYDSGVPQFPAILDTGNNHNFAISREQLRSWAGIKFSDSRHHVVFQGKRTPLIKASLWLFPNKARRVATSGRPPSRLAVPEGIVVFPEEIPNAARLPVLGLRAVATNSLKLIVDGNRRRVTLKTAGWFS
jgi:hypothetical protein